MQMLKWIGISLFSFVILLVVTFTVMKALYPPQEAIQNKQNEARLPDTSEIQNEELERVLTLYKKIKVKYDSLNRAIEDYKNRLASNQAVTDSIRQRLSMREASFQQKNEQLNNLKKQLAKNRSLEKNAIALAKTFSGMDAKEMAPIVRDLDNRTVIKLYRNMNSRARRKLLTALSNKRAAAITKSLMLTAGVKE